MCRWLLCVGVALTASAVLAGCGAHEPVAQSGPLCQRTGSALAEQPLPADLEAVFDPVVAKGKAAMDAVGLTVAVQCAESPLYVKGYGSADLASGGPATADTVYEIGSISKQFVAAEIMKLAHETRLSLDDPIGRFLPWLPADWQPITLKQLLSHTGGVPDHYAIFRANPKTRFDWTRDYTAAQLVKAFLALDDELVEPPGTTFSYSNTDYVMLTAVIEQLTGERFAVAMKRAFFEPLGLGHTAFCSAALPDLAVGYNIGPHGPIPGPKVPASFFSGAAGICSTAGDLVHWERELVAGKAVSREAFQAMSSRAALNDGTAVPYGLGLHLETLGQSEAIFHEGGTVSSSSWLAYYPDRDLIVSVLSNTLGENAARIRDLVVDLTTAIVDQ